MARIFIARHALAREDQLVEVIARPQIELIKSALANQRFGGPGAVVRHSSANRAVQTAAQVAAPFGAKLIKEAVLGDEGSSDALPWAVKMQVQADELWVTHEDVIRPILTLVGLDFNPDHDVPYGCLYQIDFRRSYAKRLV